MAYNIHNFLDTVAEDGPMIAVTAIVAYIGYNILKDINRKGHVGERKQ